MFNEYLKKLLPIPIIGIEVSKDGYSYRITTYSRVIEERGVEKMVEGRIIKNKRIKKFYGWFLKPHEPFYKQAVITFQKVGAN